MTSRDGTQYLAFAISTWPHALRKASYFPVSFRPSSYFPSWGPFWFARGNLSDGLVKATPCWEQSSWVPPSSNPRVPTNCSIIRSYLPSPSRPASRMVCLSSLQKFPFLFFRLTYWNCSRWPPSSSSRTTTTLAPGPRRLSFWCFGRF